MYWQARFSRNDPDQEITAMMYQIREKHCNYGCLRMTKALRAHGYLVNKKKVARLLRENGLKVTAYGRRSRRYSSYRGDSSKPKRNLIKRRFNTSIVHQKITTDTTEFKYFERDGQGRLRQRKLYLDPFMDLFNHEILTFRISKRPNAETIMSALRETISLTSDCQYWRTFHSDRGWAYQMTSYQSTLKQEKIFQSFSRKGNCYDNSPMENFSVS